MKIGYCCWLLSGVSLPERFEFLAAEGCGSVSLLQSVMGCDKGEKRDAAAVLRERDLTLCFHGNVQNNLGKTPGTFDESFLAALYDEIDWWREASGGRLHDCFSDSLNVPAAGATPAGRIALTFELFRRHAAHFAGTHVRYGIENTCGSRQPGDEDYYNCGRRFREAFEAFGGASGAGILLDVGHAYVAARTQGRGIGPFVDAIPLEICELHVTDNHGDNDEHLRPGAGTLDFAALRDALARRGFDGPVNMEVCKDISKGLYAFDLRDPAERETVRAILADARAFW